MKLEVNGLLYDFERAIAQSNVEVECLESSGHSFTFLIQGKVFHIEMVDKDERANSYLLEVNGKSIEVKVKSKLAILLEEIGMGRKEEAVSLDIIAPMPGKILEVMVSVGDFVEKGQTVLVLEAMKMQNSIKALSDFQVTKVHVQEGQSIEKGALLIACGES